MLDYHDISTYGFALLAFVLAYYALLARERQAPYMVSSIYSIAFLILLALLTSTIATFLPDTTISAAPPPSLDSPTATPTTASLVRLWLLRLSASLLFLALIALIHRMWREMNRHVWFRDDHLFRNLRIVQGLRNVGRRLKLKTPYEYSPGPLPTALRSALKANQHLPPTAVHSLLACHDNHRLSSSLAVELSDRPGINSIVVDLALEFLKSECAVQYLTCIRHPFEFLHQLQVQWPDASKDEWTRRLVVIDGYTPHFGFTDSIHAIRTRQSADLCTKVVSTPSSFAGLHTATARAFNVLKAADASSSRSPTLVIYEGCSALIDLESERQYRLFVTHVVPSERMWGGMFTVFVEPPLSDPARNVLKSTCDVYLDESQLLAPQPTQARQGIES